MAGRPTSFTPEIGTKICTRIAEGESVREICRDDNMPCRRTVSYWLVRSAASDAPEEQKAFLRQYDEATAIRAENMFDEMEEIADDGSNDYMTRVGKDGEGYEVTNHEHINRSKLRIDVRKWKLSKMFPKRFGDRVQQDIKLDASESLIDALMNDKECCKK